MIGFGVVGTGRMAARMARVIAGSGEARLVHVASSSAERARDFAGRHAIAAAGDMAGLLADPAVEAVYVAGHNRDHAAVSIAALGAGKAVLCEKPFALFPQAAEAVVGAARAAGKPFMEAMATPFLPAVAEIIARVQSGEFGTVRHVEASFGYPVDAVAEPALFAADAGVLLDRMVYPLTLALLLQGPVIGQQADGAGTHDVRLHLVHDGGGRSDLAASFTRRLPNRLVIDGDAGRISVAAPLLTGRRLSIGRGGSGFLAQNPVIRRIGDIMARRNGDWRPYGASPYLPELRHFCAMVRAGHSESRVLTHRLMLDVQRIVAATGAAS